MINYGKIFERAIIKFWRLNKRFKEYAKYDSMLNVRMLWKDIHNSVMPIGGRSKNKNFDVKTEPASPELKTILIKGLSGRHPPRYIKEAVCSFINDCAPKLLINGYAVYSLDYVRKGSVLVKFNLKPIEPALVLKIFRGQYFRVNISGFGLDTKITGLSKLPNDKTFFFTLPKNLRKNLKIAKRNLVVLDSRRAPEWSILKPGLSLEILKSQALAVLEATKTLGWNARRPANEEITEYYYLQRFLSFEKFKIVLRNSILKTLNNILETISPPGVKPPSIVIAGIPTIADVNEMEKKLIKSSSSFEGIIGPFLHY